MKKKIQLQEAVRAELLKITTQLSFDYSGNRPLPEKGRRRSGQI